MIAPIISPSPSVVAQSMPESSYGVSMVLIVVSSSVLLSAYDILHPVCTISSSIPIFEHGFQSQDVQPSSMLLS